MAKGLNVPAMDVTGAELESEGVIFLGSGCYGGKPSPKMMDFIAANTFQGRKCAIFGTSGGGEGIHLPSMESALKENGASIVGSFDCKGKTFGLVNRGRPNAEDLENAKKFAFEIANY